LDFYQAAKLIADADGLLISAGAGMGVDTGLPDFRSEGGFWKHYPALAKARIGFTSIACPQAFGSEPQLAWGFYGHRLRLYRETIPHDGFHILKRWSDSKPNGSFVFTSNVDGQFQLAGFDPKKILEVHGSIHHLQCLNSCNGEIWSSDTFDPLVDDENCMLLTDPPTCRDCGGIARPNILMFGDWDWLDAQSKIQETALKHWLENVEHPVVIELGAGNDIPTVRVFGESQDARVIRINLRESQVRRKGDLGLPLTALKALKAIEKLLL